MQGFFDFDNFKPFNDKSGFRTGDRGILLFAEMLGTYVLKGDRFVGHIGGHDFFLGIHGEDLGTAIGEIVQLSGHFRDDVAAFSDENAQKAGHILVRDREGREKSLP